MRARHLICAGAVVILAGCGGTTPAPASPTTSTPTPAATTASPTPSPSPTVVSVPKPSPPRPPRPPRPTRTTAAPEEPVEVYYRNCDAARAAGAAPIRRGEPGYRKALDRDGDGVACDR